MGQKCKFEKDFEEVSQFFPKLSFKKNDKSKSWMVFGELDICDQAGEYWDTFEIIIYIAENYPYCIPLVKEKSKIIQREVDWHISEDGFCCLDIEHKLLNLKQRGINLTEFIKTKVYTYFANQLYRKSEGNYADGEYEHHFGGIRQFYEEDLKIKDVDIAIDILCKIISNRLPGRNDPCPCGKGKFKNCWIFR